MDHEISLFCVALKGQSQGQLEFEWQEIFMLCIYLRVIYIDSSDT